MTAGKIETTNKNLKRNCVAKGIKALSKGSKVIDGKADKSANNIAKGMGNGNGSSTQSS